jgi:hypothetical protein
LNIKMRRAVIVVLVSVLVAPATATTIAVLWSPDRIVMASDSLVENFQPEDIEGLKMCKIDNHGGFFFAAWGMFHDDEARLDMPHTVRKYFVDSGRIKEKANASAAEIRGPLLKAFQYGHKTQSPKLYKKYVASRNAGGFVVAAISNRGPVIVTVEFLRQDDAKGYPVDMIPHVDLVDNTISGAKSQYRLLGATTAAQRLVKTKGFHQYDITTAARKLIQAEIDDEPDRVGPPIDVVEIDKQGHRWIVPHGECSY